MAPKQAPWAKQIQVQRTVVRRPAAEPAGQYGPVAPMAGYGAAPGGGAPVPPLSAAYTGMGADGRLQRNKPTTMVNTSQGPQMLHEGELTVSLPGGKSLVIPAAKLGQEALSYLEQHARIPGKATGGTFAPTAAPTTPGAAEFFKDQFFGRPSRTKTPTAAPKQPAPIAALGSTITLTDAEKRAAANRSAPMSAEAASRTGTSVTPLAPLSVAPTVAETPTIGLTDADKRRMANQSATMTPEMQSRGISDMDRRRMANQSATMTPEMQSRGISDMDRRRMANQSAVMTPEMASRTASSVPATLPPDDAPATGTANAAGATDQAFQYMVDTMNGMNPNDKKIAEYYLGNFDVSAASDYQALMNRISRDPNMSEGAKRQMMAGLQRSQAIGRGNMGAQLALDSIQRADTAARDVFRFGREITTYEDTQLRNSYNDAIAAGDYDTAARVYKEMTGKTLDVSVMREDREYLQNQQRLNIETTETNLGITRYNQAVSMVRDGIPFGDGSAFDLDGDGTPDIDQAAYNAISQNLTEVDPDGRLDTLVAGNRTLEQVLQDQTLRTAIGRELNTTDATAIDNEITMRYETATKPLPERIWERFTQEGLVPPEFMDTPGLREEFEEMVRYLSTHSLIDNDGNLVEGAAFEFPWDDPESFFRYRGWNGWNDDLDYENGQGYDPATAVNIEGNGTTYVTDAGGAVTFADMERAWNDPDVVDKREDYFTGGRFDRELFMKDNFKATAPGGGAGALPEFDPEKNPEDLDTWGDFEDGFIPMAFPQDYVTENAAALGGEGSINLAGLFGYYDHNGIWQHESTNSGTLQSVWEQFSEHYGNGEMLSVDKFQRLYWKNGDGWVISPAGRVMNFDSDFQAQHGLSAENPRIENAGYGSNMIGALNKQNMVSLPVEGADRRESRDRDYQFGVYGGRVHTTMTADWNIYDLEATGYIGDYWNSDTSVGDIGLKNYTKFEPEITGFFNSNVGKVITIGDRYYRIAESPIIEKTLLGTGEPDSVGNTNMYLNFYTDAVRLIDIQSGETVHYNFNTEYQFRD